MNILIAKLVLIFKEVLRIIREFKCCAGCCWFAGCCDGCSFEVVIMLPSGDVMGYVKQK